MPIDIATRRAKARPLSPIAAAIREASWLARAKAEELEVSDAFQARQFNDLSKTLTRLVLDAEDMELDVS